MSIAAGVLTYSSLYTLLPAAQARLQFNPLPLFLGGVILNVLLIRLVHAITPKQFSSYESQQSSEPLKFQNSQRRRQADVENYGATGTLRQPHDQPQAHSVTASHYLQIGIQTTVAMCLHKLPGKVKPLSPTLFICIVFDSMSY
jgi:zinc transporter ZupT